MNLRGIRGATTIEADRPEMILAATHELLRAILTANPGLQPGDIASAFFTMTEDLRSAYPALAARQMGWDLVPMVCGREIPVPGSLPRCIRILVLWNSELAQADVCHVYLHEAASLRPDLAGKNPIEEGDQA
jgi:chorismate mutase